MGRITIAVCVALFVVGISSLSPKKQKKAHHYRTANFWHKNPLKRDVVCPSYQFACPERCITQSWHCDGEDDCMNGFDEASCAGGCNNANQFQCANGGCVPSTYKCDNDDDCGDGSDEMNCGGSTATSCHSYQFACASGRCVPGDWKCDGDDDCGDGSDENVCGSATGRTCVAGEFTCSNGHCVPQAYLCDGDNDCDDSSDETGCSCTSSQFHCDHGGCVPKTYLCDGDDDCADFSDEKCPDIPDTQCADKMSLTDCAHMNSSTFPICTEPSDAFKHCRKFCKMCENFGGSSTTKTVG